ncbi:LETM1-like protein [Ophiocordyceps sinensis CO18]|uniref:LETM1-like protein n=1 Tax=Ophiocordyceps sinensis (strain Co18 / CGMCC 3.14243) TaxID=911162 RepID=T5AJV1_OPHSC|nr:LETM1-like protein [Ophiocordyceps sinensis CO18]
MNHRIPSRLCRSSCHSALRLHGSLVPLRRAHRDALPPPKSPLLNPPASTRPPPLTVPQRSSVDSTFQYLFQMGKGYVRFYKDGLKGVWASRKLLRQKLDRTPRDDRPSIWRPYHVPKTFSRADWVLLWRVKGRLRMAFLEGDDANLIEDGGPLGLEPAELVIACKERGIDTLGESEADLMSLLGDWLRLTAAEDIAERRRRMATLLLTRVENWPEHRDFAVPEWEL